VNSSLNTRTATNERKAQAYTMDKPFTLSYLLLVGLLPTLAAGSDPVGQPFKIPSVRAGVDFSADGSYIGMVVECGSRSSNDRHVEIRILDAHTMKPIKGKTPLPWNRQFPAFSDLEVTWSPQSAEIVVAYYRKEAAMRSCEIWDVRSGAQLDSFNVMPWRPARPACRWDLNGEYILTVAAEDAPSGSSRPVLMRYDVAAKSLKKLSLTIDGNVSAYDSDGEHASVFVSIASPSTGSEGGTMSKVYRFREGAPSGELVCELPQVEVLAASPDGSHIACIVLAPGVGMHRSHSLYVIDAARNSSALVSDLDMTRSAKWCPDGSRLAFIRNLDLWVYEVSTERLNRIPASAIHPWSVFWDRDDFSLWTLGGGTKLLKRVDGDWETKYELPEAR